MLELEILVIPLVCRLFQTAFCGSSYCSRYYHHLYYSTRLLSSTQEVATVYIVILYYNIGGDNVNIKVL